MERTFMLIADPGRAVSADRISEVLDTRSPSTARDGDGVDLTRHLDLDVADVSFTYPGAEQPVLGDVCFSARPVETVAIIGSTGAGKTTLVNLVPRLFDATTGRVLIDGVDVRDLDPEMLWSRIGLVPQRAFLFTGTVASNLRYGNADASEDELWRALEIAQAREFVGRCRNSWKRRSSRAAPTCPADSGSGWRSRGRWYGVPRSISSTMRSPRSTSPPTLGCVRRCEPR